MEADESYTVGVIQGAIKIGQWPVMKQMEKEKRRLQREGGDPCSAEDAKEPVIADA